MLLPPVGPKTETQGSRPMTPIMVRFMSYSSYYSINPDIIALISKLLSFFSSQKLALRIAECQSQAFKSSRILPGYRCPLQQ